MPRAFVSMGRAGSITTKACDSNSTAPRHAIAIIPLAVIFWRRACIFTIAIINFASAGDVSI